jgi:drug/metabolite transporter (DMT)-like permease
MRRGILAAFAAATISGVAVFLNGYGVRAVPNATVYTTAKNLVAAVLLGVLATGLALARRSRRPAVATARAPWRPSQIIGLVAVGVFGGAVAFVLFFEGLARASSTHAAFIQKTLVIWVALLAVPLLGERVRAVHYGAIGLLVGGLVLLDGNLRGFGFGTGEALILAATLLWAAEVILVKRLVRGVHPETIALARMGLGVVVLLTWVAISGKWTVLAHLNARGWGWAVLTGAILAAYVATWFTALALAPAIDVTAVLVVGAVITAGLSSWVKGTPIHTLDGVGLVLLVCGATAVALARRGPRAVAAA